MSKLNILKNKNKLKRAIPVYKNEWKNRKILIWGTGNTTALYQKGLERESISPLYYIDNDINKAGSEIFGKKVLTPSQLKDFMSDDYIILVCSAQPKINAAILRQINEMGFLGINIDEYIFSKNKDRVMSVLYLFEDDFSRDTYTDLIISRMKNLDPNPKYFSNEVKQYFALPEFLKRDKNFVFVDLGAFVGDSLDDFVYAMDGTFKTAYEFEPDIINFRALQIRTERIKKEWGFSDDKIITIKAGVGEKSSIGYVTDDVGTSNLGSKLVDKSSNEINVYSIDDYFKNIKISELKMDIESYEYDTILGAETVIKRDFPIMCVCIYHNASDMIDLPLLIRKINPSYKFKLLHHRYEYDDAVLYCY